MDKKKFLSYSIKYYDMHTQCKSQSLKKFYNDLTHIHGNMEKSLQLFILHLVVLDEWSPLAYCSYVGHNTEIYRKQL